MSENPNKALNVSINSDKAAAQATAQAFVEHLKNTRDLIDAYQDLKKAGSDLGSTSAKSLNAATKAADETAKSVAKLRQEYIKTADAAGKNKGNIFKDLTEARGVGHAIGTIVGENPVSSGLKRVGAIGHLGEEYEEQIDRVNKAITSAAPIFGELTVAIGATEVAISPLLLVLAPLVAIVGTVALVMKLLSDQAEETAKKEKEAYDNEKQLLLEREADRQKAKTMSTAQNQSNLETLVQNRLDAIDEVAKQKAARATTTQQYGALGTSLNVPERNRLRALGEQQDKDIADASQHLADLNKQYIDLTGVLQPMIDKEEAHKKALQDKLDAEQKAQQAITETAAREVEMAKLRQSGSLDSVKAMIEENKINIEQKTKETSALKELFSTQEKGTPAYDKAKEAYEASKKATDDLTESNKELLDSVLPVVTANQYLAEANKVAKDSSEEYRKSLVAVSNANAAVTALENDRTKQLNRQKEDETRNAARTATEKDFQLRIDAAKQREAEAQVQAENEKAATEAQVKYGDSKKNIDKTFFDNSLKSLRSYIEDEKNLKDRADKERLRTAQDAETDLRRLAGEGDVAGFIDRQQKAKTDLQRQSEDASEAAQQRRKQFEEETRAAEDEHRKQMADLNTSFATEKAARDSATDQRIRDIKNSGQQANSESARLEQELNSIREKWRREDLARQRADEQQSYDERLAVQKQKQKEILAETTRFFNDWMRAVQNGANTGQPGFTSGGGAYGSVSQYAGGLDRVPHDRFPAFLDKGEKVLTERQAAEYDAHGAGGGDVYVTIQNTVGDIATASMLEQSHDTIIEGIRQSFTKAKGRSNG